MNSGACPTKKDSERRGSKSRAWPGPCLLLALLLTGAVAADDGARHLRLLDRLDRPDDGYCVDILGVGDYLRVDLPLFAHNCKPVLTADSAVIFGADGRLFFPAVNRCITVAGVNSRALPGASVLLRGCGEKSAFFETAQLQSFSLHADGRLTLTGTALCLAVGAESASTYSRLDRWRALFVADCADIPPARARWALVTPGQADR